jgi:hypothetical protein
MKLALSKTKVSTMFIMNFQTSQKEKGKRKEDTRQDRRSFRQEYYQ